MVRQSFALLLVALLPLTSWSADRVTFDVPATVAARDVTTPELQAVRPHERLVEIKVHISTLHRGEPADELQLFHRFDFPQRGIEIVDYLPKTTMATDVAGNITIETQNEDCNTLGLVLTGSQPPLTATLNGSASDKQSKTIKYELLPPLETVAASGTLNRRAAAYFRLKPTPRISLEGDKEFVLIARVPATWRGTYLLLRSHATGEQSMAAPPFRETVTLGHASFVLGVYLEGDVEAQRAAQQFALAEQHLRVSVAQHQKQIERRAYPTVIHKVGAMLSLADPKVPADWLETLIYAPPASDAPLARLPRPVLDAAEQYQVAREALARLGF